ncbi:MAG: LD-carboxypeptidase [Erysipelotrichia bacterium]|nr:LD-carboxypeptidase [Erysipelotrichia bacterium]
MRYASFLKKQDTIGLVAPSFGVSGYPYQERFEHACKKFTNLGYKIKQSECLYGIDKAASAPSKVRAEQFMQMYLDLDTDFIISVAGGELMMSILTYIDFDTLKYAKPKYFMGYSDNTNLVFTLPILTDTAAIYGSNFGSFGMANWDKSLQECYDLITGKRKEFSSYEQYEINDLSHQEGKALCGYNLEAKVEYKTLDGKDVDIKGRLVGGCLDILVSLCGTKYGQVEKFIDKYQDDGFIWFLEACDLNVLAQSRALWQLRQAGWFKYCKGILYGRAVHSDDCFGYTLVDALKDNLADLNIPIVYGCDFGHIPPSWTLIAGSVAHFTLQEDRAQIEFELKQ